MQPWTLEGHSGQAHVLGYGCTKTTFPLPLFNLLKHDVRRVRGVFAINTMTLSWFATVEPLSSCISNLSETVDISLVG